MLHFELKICSENIWNESCPNIAELHGMIVVDSVDILEIKVGICVVVAFDAIVVFVVVSDAGIDL